MLLDVSSLDRHTLFRCDSPQRSHAEVAQAFCDHGLRWRPGRVDTTMGRLRFGALELFSLQYGAEVEVQPRAFADFALVHVSLTGVLNLEGDGATLARRAGDVVLLGRQPSLRMQWSAGTRQLILKVPRHCLPDDVALPPCVAFDPVQARQLKGLLQALLCAAPLQQPAPPGQATWVSPLEDSIMLFLAQLLRGAAAPAAPPAPAEAAGGRDHRRIDRMMAYLQGRLGAPVGLEDMARAAGLSPRGLHLLCQRQLGRTPMVILRDLRLDAVRERLLAAPDAAITDVALAHGFGHLGRFAGYYRERFGELPTETLRACAMPAAAAA